ncbi:hypothetical protein CWI36_0731p0020, partial [Hamiltosporidium magnivora]
LLSGFKHFESQDINLCLHNIMDHISEKSFIQNLEKCLINLFDVYKNFYSLKSSLDNRLDNRLYNMVALPLKKFLEELITKIEEFDILDSETKYQIFYKCNDITDILSQLIT